MRTIDFMQMSHSQAAMKASDIAYENEQLRQQLAASQAREQRYREALIDMQWSEDGCEKKTIDALSQPTDTSALDAMIAKAGEVMRERCVKHCDEVESQYFDGYEFRNVLPSDMCDDIRALPGVTMKDLK